MGEPSEIAGLNRLREGDVVMEAEAGTRDRVEHTVLVALETRAEARGPGGQEGDGGGDSPEPPGGARPPALFSPLRLTLGS